MTALAQPAAIETPKTQAPVVIGTTGDVLQLPSNVPLVTVFVVLIDGIPRFSLDMTSWFTSMAWSCGSEYSLFIAFTVLSPIELQACSDKTTPWFSPPSEPLQYACVPWVSEQTTFHFNVVPDNGPVIDPQIVVTPVTIFP